MRFKRMFAVPAVAAMLFVAGCEVEDNGTQDPGVEQTDETYEDDAVEDDTFDESDDDLDS